MKTISETLRSAAGVIKSKGWTQNQAIDDEGRVCMTAAIGDVNGHGGPSYWRAVEFLRDKVLGTGSVVVFNDCHCKRKQDAIAALEIGADIAEAMGV
jgi:hypothetical protein